MRSHSVNEIIGSSQKHYVMCDLNTLASLRAQPLNPRCLPNSENSKMTHARIAGWPAGYATAELGALRLSLAVAYELQEHVCPL